MDPFSLGTGVFGLLGNFMQQRNMRKQMDFQATENQKDRDFNSKEAELSRQFNSDEAQKARDFNLEMWNLENEYNAPKAVMQRLKAAGLNPNLAYGDIGQLAAGMGNTGVSASSGAASHAGSYASSMPGFVNPAKEAAEVALLQSQAKKNDSERGLTDKEIFWFDKLKQGEFDYLGVNIRFTDSLRNKTDKEIEEIAKNIEKVDVEMQHLFSMIDLNDAQTSKVFAERVGLMLDNKLKEANFENAVRKFSAETKLAEDESRVFLSVVAADVALKNSQAYLNNSQVKEISEHINLMVNQKHEIWSRIGINLKYSEKLGLEIGEMDRQGYRYDPNSTAGKILVGFEYVGDCLRGLAGGLITGSANINRSSSSSHSTIVNQ